MTRRLLPLLLLLPVLSLAAAPRPSIRVADAQAVLHYPDSIDFTLQATSTDPIVTAEVEYGLETASCATDINRAEPEDYEPAGTIDVQWTWDMRQTGSLPPGARLWWRWHLVDSTGQELRTTTETVTWLDDVHAWQTLTEGNLSLHTYNAPPAMARQLLDAAVGGAIPAAERTRSAAGRPGQPVHLRQHRRRWRDAILFEPQWTGGMAFAEHRTIILGIGESDLEWGLNAVEHELAHVIVGNLVSACYSRLPTWLSEGLAMVAEGGLDAESQRLLDQALQDDTFYPVRALSDGFTEDPGGASLAYAQSYSLVTYLLEAHGRERLARPARRGAGRVSPGCRPGRGVRLRHGRSRPRLAQVDRRPAAPRQVVRRRIHPDRHADLSAAGRAAAGDHRHACPLSAASSTAAIGSVG